MPHDQAVVIDTDQEVMLRVTIAVGEEFSSTSQETLTQKLVAPLYIIRSVREEQVEGVVRKLFRRVLEKYTRKLGEQQRREARRKELQDLDDTDTS